MRGTVNMTLVGNSKPFEAITLRSQLGVAAGALFTVDLAMFSFQFIKQIDLASKIVKAYLVMKKQVLYIWAYMTKVCLRVHIFFR